jgi:NFU1 iron-sulfur cluster scaffold homolog, mitochondrial
VTQGPAVGAIKGGAAVGQREVVGRRACAPGVDGVHSKRNGRGRCNRCHRPQPNEARTIVNEEISYTYKAADGGRIRVIVEPSPNQANVCRFIVDPPVYPEGGVHFGSKSNASEAPLAEALFELADVSEILIAGNSVTLTTDEPKVWGEYAESVAKLIRDQINSGVPAVSPAFTEGLPSSENIRERVQELIDTAINPAVASHGGIVTLLDVKGNNIFLEFGGGCQGCGMVSVTLKYGVEKLLRDRIPELGQVLDTTDHAAGTNPYYAPASK